MKIIVNKKLISIAVASIFITGFASQNVFSDIINEQISISKGRTLSPQTDRIISRSAAKVLRQIAQARTAIHAKDIDRAKKDLREIIFQIDLIKSEMPSAKIHDHISVAKQHLEYETTEEVIDDMVPIESSLLEIEDYMPVKKAKTHLHEARKQLKKGNKKAAVTALKAADSEIVYTEIDLPLSSTESHIKSAQSALNNNQPDMADKALKQAENGVEFISEIISSPVIQVRKGFWNALKYASKANYTALKNELSSIDKWLTRLTKSTDKITHDEAVKMKTELQDLKQQITQKAHNYNKQLESLWHRSKTLAERESDKSLIGWKNKRPDADIRADLIDAKQKVAFAENLQFYAMTDPDDIFKAIEQATAILEKVMVLNKFDEKGQKELKQAIKELKMIHSTPTPDHQNLYELVRARLRGLIHNNY